MLDFNICYILNFQKKVKSTDTQRFVGMIDRLKNEKGVSYAAIARKIGEEKHRIVDIRMGKSSADTSMIDKLLEVYPELDNPTKDEVIQSNIAIEELRRENEELKAFVAEMQKEILDQNKMIRDLTDRYLKLIEPKQG